MYLCKSRYDYERLIANYFEANLKQQYISGEISIKPSWASTAGRRLSFRGEYLISYNTSIARIVHTKLHNYLYVSTYSYSNTTSKQIRLLKENTPSSVILINADNINSNFCDIKDQYLSTIIDTYRSCKTARKGVPLQNLLNFYKQTILDVIPELHHQTAAATLRKLALLPNIPDKLDKFTRTALFSVLKERKLL